MEPEKQREGFGSRLGFILVSAGCAIGIGNVWRFPTVTGQYGGWNHRAASGTSTAGSAWWAVYC